jgi:hypothetical protein
LILDTKKVQDVGEDKVKDAEGDGVKDGQSEKVEDAQGEIAAESSSKLMDDTSSTEDEDIRLVVEDASDETDTEPQVAKTPEINTEETKKLTDKSDDGIEVEKEEPIKESNDADKDLEKASENPPVEELLSDDELKIISEKPLVKVLSDDIQDPSSPMDSGIALDNITSNFDEDSCTSFDKSLEEIDPKKTEDKNETPKDDVPVEKILDDEAVIIEPELVAKANSNDEETAMEINEVEENKNETSTGKIHL